MLFCSIFRLFYQAGSVLVCLPGQVTEAAEGRDMAIFNQHTVSDM